MNFFKHKINDGYKVYNKAVYNIWIEYDFWSEQERIGKKFKIFVIEIVPEA